MDRRDGHAGSTRWLRRARDEGLISDRPNLILQLIYDLEFLSETKGVC
jgi:hypothetical protein